MLKISDILKKRGTKSKVSPPLSKNNSKPPVEQPDATEKEEVRQNLQQEKSNYPQYPKEKTLPSSPVFEENLKIEIIDDQEAINAYDSAIALSAKLMKSFSDDGIMLIENIKEVIEKFIRSLIRDEGTLLRLFFNDYADENNYIYQHSVNVCILSLYIAKFFNYNHAKLQQIGLAAFVHDIGLIPYDNLINKPKRLTQEEYNEIKKHPITGKNILAKISQNIDLDILDTVAQEHERIDGGGYPYALKDKEICETAKLIGLVDTYEAVMHSRPYRNKFKCTDALKQIIENKQGFDSDFIKTLINLVGVFPVATLIRLNTKEVGMVLRQSYQMPLRPIVNITHNAQGQQLNSSKCINLATNFSIYIQECFTEQNQKSG